ncbi:MAG: secretion protein [Symploca sp. SIO2C1]|nr:secretion protein [Symploca sp. SIO2C1]
MYRNQFIRVTLASLGSALFLGAFNSSPVDSQSFDLGAFQKSALSEHNTYRATHHSPAMTQSSSANSTAQAYAEKMLSTGRFLHSSESERNGAGENLYYTYSEFPLDPADLAARAVGAWYEEVVDYDYNNPGFSVDTGHFTQVVWKSTTQLGCGVAQGPKVIAGRNATINYVVCHYTPHGNFYGEYPSNVLQP